MASDSQPLVRSDGRTSAQLRPLEAAKGLLSRADGSAKLTQGKTTVLAAVYGPMPAPRRQEELQGAAVQVSFTPSTGSTSYTESHYATVCQDALRSVILCNLHPRTKISIVLQVIHDDGSVLAAAINAATLALLDAGVDCDGMVVATAFCWGLSGKPGMEEEEDEDEVPSWFFLDPRLQEEAQASGSLTLAVNVRTNAVVLSQAHGMLDADERFFQCVKYAQKAALSQAGFIRASVTPQVLAAVPSTSSAAGKKKKKKKKKGKRKT